MTLNLEQILNTSFSTVLYRNKADKVKDKTINMAHPGENICAQTIINKLSAVKAKEKEMKKHSGETAPLAPRPTSWQVPSVAP